MTFLLAYKHVLGTLFYWLDKATFGTNAYTKKHWQQ